MEKLRLVSGSANAPPWGLSAMSSKAKSYVFLQDSRISIASRPDTLNRLRWNGGSRKDQAYIIIVFRQTHNHMARVVGLYESQTPFGKTDNMDEIRPTTSTEFTPICLKCLTAESTISTPSNAYWTVPEGESQKPFG